LSLADVTNGAKRPKVLYLVGDVPFMERPECGFLIVQDNYLPPFKVDAFLPAASFAEAGGTLVNVEGRVQEIVPVESPTEGAVAGFMRPDWRIFSDLAKALQCPGMDYRTREDVVADIRKAVPDFPPKPDRLPRQMKQTLKAGTRGQVSGARARNSDHKTPTSTFLFVAEPAGYRHRGIDIASKVKGLGELAMEEGFRMNPEDIALLGLADGDQITVSLDNGVTASGPVKSNRECPKGAIYYTRPVVFGGLSHRLALQPLYRLEPNPARASVRKA
jgi:anaerobic selenocysteine-containing dehydrogenase